MGFDRLGLDPQLCRAVADIDVTDLVSAARVVAVPMRVKFRGITTREAVLFEGPAGWGEFAPFPEYPPAEAAAWLAAGIESAFVGLPRPGCGQVPLNGTVPAVAPDRVAAVVGRFPGCETFKIKVAEQGGCLADDVARVNRVRRLRPGAAIRVDANRGWSIDQAVKAARVLGEVEYIEQPCRSVAELKELKHRLAGLPVKVAIAADESVRRADDPLAVIAAGAVDAVVLKAAPLGGVRRLVAVAGHAVDAGMSVTVASALDTAVGMTSGLVAASLVPGVRRAAGLGTGRLFAADVADGRQPVNGRMAVQAVAPDPRRLDRLAAPADRCNRWRTHLAQSLDQLRRQVG